MDPHPQELLIAYTMVLVGSAIPTVGLTAQLIPFPGELFYFATPENDWQTQLQPYVKSWLVPQDDLAVIYCNISPEKTRTQPR